MNVCVRGEEKKGMFGQTLGREVQHWLSRLLENTLKPSTTSQLQACLLVVFAATTITWELNWRIVQLTTRMKCMCSFERFRNWWRRRIDIHHRHCSVMCCFSALTLGPSLSLQHSSVSNGYSEPLAKWISLTALHKKTVLEECQNIFIGIISGRVSSILPLTSYPPETTPPGFHILRGRDSRINRHLKHLT